MSLCSRLNHEVLGIAFVDVLLLLLFCGWFALHLYLCLKQKGFYLLLFYPVIPWLTMHLFILKGHGSTEAFLFVFMLLVFPAIILFSLFFALLTSLFLEKKGKVLTALMALYVLVIPPVCSIHAPFELRSSIIAECRDSNYRPI